MLQGPDGKVIDNAGMFKIVVQYYKKLFGSEPRLDINLAEGLWSQDEMVTNLNTSALNKRLKMLSLALVLGSGQTWEDHWFCSCSLVIQF
jgi:hypothetical protein